MSTHPLSHCSPLFLRFDSIKNGLSISPHTQEDFFPTHAEWLQIREGIDHFYATQGHTVDAHNQKLFNKRSRPGASKRVSKPKKPVTVSTRRHRATKGFVYVIQSEMGHYKIGKAKDPYSRNHTIGTEHAYRTWLVYVAKCTDHTRAERVLHEALAEWRLNGEWFGLPPEKLEWVVSHTWVSDLSMQAVVVSGERINP